jgi:Family of unknown function (DUF5681)
MTDVAESTAPKQRGRPWPKGRSGNPHGRPTGSRNRATLIAEALLDGEAEQLTRTAIKLAHGGDVTALRLCLERLIPPRRERTVRFKLPKITCAADASQAMAAIAQAVAKGELGLGEAAEFGKLIEAYVKVVEVADFEARVRALEEREAP